MKRLLSAWLPRSRRESAGQQVLQLGSRSTAQWEPIPDDIAEWMGMRPYVAAEQQAAAS